MAQKQATRLSQNQAITLKGSTAIVTEFFEYSVNRYAMSNILWRTEMWLRGCARAYMVVFYISEASIRRMTSGELARS